MQDIAIQLLLNHLQHLPADANSIWFADENSLSALAALAAHTQKAPAQSLTILTNRYDIYQQAKQLGLISFFNDADLKIACKPKPDAIFIRISKEKPVTHHIINQAARQLATTGTLYLAGYKSEGVKTYARKTCELFGSSSALKKNKDAHIASFTQPHGNNSATLDTKNYNQLRTIGEHNGVQLISKPGVFGFEKIDEGSKLLLEAGYAFLTQEQRPQKQRLNQQARLLDLGCGYGLLALSAQQWGVRSITATDNNAAALAAIKAGTLGKSVQPPDSLPAITIYPADAGAGIEERFNIILCNPPFHQGFDVDNSLTDKFLGNARQLLESQGVALFVVNSFIAIEKKAAAFFKHQKTLVNNSRFKVLALSNTAIDP